MIKNGGYDYLARIKENSSHYFIEKYTEESYNDFSDERIGYLEKINLFVEKHNITLYTYLTPVHCYHLNKIKEHELLNNTLIRFKSLLLTKFNFIDFMIENKENCKNENYYDAVHQSNYIAKLIVDDLFSEKLKYGKRIKSN